jgi:hypothetical protein
MLNHKNIWEFRQNKPTLIVKDLEQYAPPEVVYYSLLTRGVFKWFVVRKKLIKLKNLWKSRITESIEQQRQLTNYAEKMYLRGYRRALEDCRKEVRELCHSQRWQAPSDDRAAQKYLDSISREVSIDRPNT